TRRSSDLGLVRPAACAPRAQIRRRRDPAHRTALSVSGKDAGDGAGALQERRAGVVPGRAAEHGRVAFRRPPHRSGGGKARPQGQARRLCRAAGNGGDRDRPIAAAQRRTSAAGRAGAERRSVRMAIDIKVPALGESVTEASVGRWLKKAGDAVAMDDPLVEIETDKVTLEINAPVAGTLEDIAVAEGATVNVGAILGHIAEGKAAAAKPASVPKMAPATALAKPAPAAAASQLDRSGPAVRKLVEDKGLDAGAIAGTGRDGRLTKGDVLAASAAPAPSPVVVPLAKPAAPAAPRPAGPREQRVRMTRLRRTIAERLKEAQNTAAMLTTFNEVDMSASMALRDKYRDSFEKKHGVRLGYMSIFIKACIEALKDVPAVNAEFSGDDLIY